MLAASVIARRARKGRHDVRTDSSHCVAGRYWHQPGRSPKHARRHHLPGPGRDGRPARRRPRRTSGVGSRHSQRARQPLARDQRRAGDRPRRHLPPARPANGARHAAAGPRHRQFRPGLSGGDQGRDCGPAEGRGRAARHDDPARQDPFRTAERGRLGRAVRRARGAGHSGFHGREDAALVYLGPSGHPALRHGGDDQPSRGAGQPDRGGGRCGPRADGGAGTLRHDLQGLRDLHDRRTDRDGAHRPSDRGRG